MSRLLRDRWWRWQVVLVPVLGGATASACGAPARPGFLALSTDAPCASTPAPPLTLLMNPGFEEAGAKGWIIENATPDGAPPYAYNLTAAGGGHGDARPHTGERALEIYSSSRVTRLSQVVRLRPGRYRLAVWARNNGATSRPHLEVTLGQRVASLPVTSDAYRQYFVEAAINEESSQQVSFVSREGGLAVDDASLVRIPPGDEPPPYLFADLSPSTSSRSAGIQTYFRGRKQWLNFAFSAIAPELVAKPTLRLTAPAGVHLSGFNTSLLETWRRPGAGAVLSESTIWREAGSYTVYYVALPRLVNGESEPVEFGGCWVDVPDGNEAALAADVLNDEKVVSSQVIRLVPITPPAVGHRPTRLKVVLYDVQDWKMSGAERLSSLPALFALMGGNVWSDYGLTTDDISQVPAVEDVVRERAATAVAGLEFWPNSDQLLSLSPATTGAVPPEGRFTDINGRVAEHEVTLHYAAAGGPAWLAGTVSDVVRTVERPADLGLGYRNTGFISDALESVALSYDPATVSGFAAYAGLQPTAVTDEALAGPLHSRWLAYNMNLYARAAANLADAIHRRSPRASVVSTAGSYGPSGVESLTLTQQASWSRAFAFSMPQWYTMGYFGDLYYRTLMRGVREGVYGTATGHADVIPLWNLSMGSGYDGVASLRFKTFDVVSATSVVRGVGFYRGYYAFADAQVMTDISSLTAMLANVEDYYVLGTAVAAATFVTRGSGDTSSVSDVETSARVHLLGRAGRIALITVLSHSEHAVGERGLLKIDLQRLGVDPTRHELFDHLANKVIPLAPDVLLDTTTTGGMALLEVRLRELVP